MGAPKQKWTSEEEAALKAGIAKHGAGHWRTILKDPEFSGMLALRSNVDLKDKWRNMNVTVNGWGSREKAKVAVKKSNQNIKQQDENSMSVTRSVQSDEEIVDTNPLAVSNELLQIANPKKTIPRLENVVFEAITNQKEPSGSNKTSIGAYIEDRFEAPPNFNRILSAKLNSLTENGKLIKVKRKYRIAPSEAVSGAKRSVVIPNLERRLQDYSRIEITKSQITAELAKMRTMSASEAAAAAARAVAEAEAAIAEAEQATMEADEADAEAEAAKAFAEAAKAFAEAANTALQTRNPSNLMVHG